MNGPTPTDWLAGVETLGPLLLAALRGGLVSLGRVERRLGKPFDRTK